MTGRAHSCHAPESATRSAGLDVQRTKTVASELAAYLTLAASARSSDSAGCAKTPALSKLTWLALGSDQIDSSRGGEQAIALGRL